MDPSGHRKTRSSRRVANWSPGFISCALVGADDGVLAMVSVFETRAELEEGDRLLAAWIGSHETLLSTRTRVIGGEVLVQKGM